MARLEGQGPNETPQTQYVRQFRDHAGQEATSVSLPQETNPHATQDSLDGAFSFQVYSTSPWTTDDCHRFVKQFALEQDQETRGPVLFDFYPPQLDVLTCVEHQRREIAHRKRAQPDGLRAGGALLPPLIPRVAASASNKRRQGFLIVISPEAWECLLNRWSRPDWWDGPLLVSFDRRFPSAITVDETSLLMGPADDPVMKCMRECGDDTAFAELADMVADKVNIYDPASLSRLLWVDKYRPSFIKRSGPADFAADDEEGSPPEAVSVAWNPQRSPPLSADADGYEVTSVGTEESVTVRSKGVSRETTSLCYIIYAPFLHHFASPGNSLAAVATTFTAAITAHLPAGKTVDFEFRIPPEPSISSALQHYQNQMAALPGDSAGIGALVTMKGSLDGGSSGVDPKRRRIICHRTEREELLPVFSDVAGGRERYKTLLVVLDKPDFYVDGTGGVVLLLADGGQLIEGHKPSAVADLAPEILVLRSPTMRNVARRLGMLILEEEEMFHRPAPVDTEVPPMASDADL